MDSPLDGRQLRAFVSLARTASLTQTAKELFLTHSAISHSMKALENDVGCRLLTTVGKRIVLTEAGETLLAHAGKLIGGMRDARTAIQYLNRWGFRELRLDAEPAFFDFLLADALAAMRKENPRLLLKVAFNPPSVEREHSYHTLTACVEPDQINGFEFTPVFTDLLQFVVAPSHPWATSPERAPEEFAKEPCLMFARADPLRQTIEIHFARGDTALNVVAELESIGAIKALVRRKFGFAILPRWSVKRELAEGRLATIPLGRRALSATWGFVHRQAPLLQNVERQFIAACLAKSKLLGN